MRLGDWMVKFLHLADCGLKNLPYGGVNPETGLNRRFEDINENFRFAIKKAKEKNCKYFVIAGDINEERNPESFLIERFSTHVADLVSLGIIVIIVAGNHDVDSSKSTSTSISFIKALGLVDTYVADLKPDKFEFHDVVFHCVPYMFPHQVGLKNNTELTTWLNTYISKIKLHPQKKNILVTHYSLDTTFGGLYVDEPTLDQDVLGRFDYVALGHIHKYEMFSSFVGGYTGSMFVKDFGEEKTKHVNVVSFLNNEASIEKIELPERRFVQLEIYARDLDCDEVVRVLLKSIVDVGGIAEAIVKVRIHVRKRFNPKMLYSVLREANSFHYAPIDWKVEKVEVTTKLDIEKATTDKDIVERYYAKDEDGKSEKTKLYIMEKIAQWDEVFVS